MSDRQVRADATTVAALARELGDPTRLAVLEHLVTEGPSGVSEMADTLELSGPRLSNHLARLRSADLVTVQRDGRHAVYQVASPSIKELLASLHAAASLADQGTESGSGVPRPLSGLRQARSCYDHVAGVLGVAILDALQDQGALGPAEGIRAGIELAPHGKAVFGELGIDPDHLPGVRRRFAFACLDWTERRAHLGGALGAALLTALLKRGWLARESNTRALRVTTKGRKAIPERFGITV
jgi:DNA-binding transcriptional ArsR family regulator